MGWLCRLLGCGERAEMDAAADTHVIYGQGGRMRAMLADDAIRANQVKLLKLEEEKAQVAAAAAAKLQATVDELNAKGTADTAAAVLAWAKEIAEIGSYAPPVEAVECENGVFLRIVSVVSGNAIELPRRFIESVDIIGRGSREAPRWSNACKASEVYGIRNYGGVAGAGGGVAVDRIFAKGNIVYPKAATIKITMHSGQTLEVSCTAHQLDIFYDAIRSAWKGEEV